MLPTIPSQSLVVHQPEQLPQENQTQRRNFLRYQVKALLAIPLATVDGGLGLMVVHHCRQPRLWQKGEVRLLEQLSTQVAIAIQQAQLYQRVQQLNSGLEKQVEKRTAQLQEKMLELQDLQEMKAVFVQAICHDLRTSVMGLLMVLKNLQTADGQSFQMAKPLWENLLQSGDRQLTLLNALAEEQNAECRPLHLTKQNLNLQTFLPNICQQWRSACAQHQVSLQLLCDDNLPSVAADAHYLQRVFDNLLSNALKHNPPGIALTLSAQTNGKGVRFTLGDNGKGLAPEQCENLFRLYLRSRHNQRLTGIGLGCYQSRQIVEAHGGQIGVSSNPGQGSHFWFTLPAG
jgi:signal transduction histidine kinase